MQMCYFSLVLAQQNRNEVQIATAYPATVLFLERQILTTRVPWRWQNHKNIVIKRLRAIIIILTERENIIFGNFEGNWMLKKNEMIRNNDMIKIIEEETNQLCLWKFFISSIHMLISVIYLPYRTLTTVFCALTVNLRTVIQDLWGWLIRRCSVITHYFPYPLSTLSDAVSVFNNGTPLNHNDLRFTLYYPILDFRVHYGEPLVNHQHRQLIYLNTIKRIHLFALIF